MAVFGLGLELRGFFLGLVARLVQRIGRQLEAAEAWAAARPDIELNTTLRDLGVSAFKGDNRVKGALASFLERIKQGQIERGSYFLLESFDRLSRESESQAIHLLTGITLAVVKVVTLIDGAEYDETADAMELMRALIVMSRSHNENKARTDKVAKAWKEKNWIRNMKNC